MLTRFRYDTVLAVRLATDVACGVMEIHKEGLFHSDLKVSLSVKVLFYGTKITHAHTIASKHSLGH